MFRRDLRREAGGVQLGPTSGLGHQPPLTLVPHFLLQPETQTPSYQCSPAASCVTSLWWEPALKATAWAPFFQVPPAARHRPSCPLTQNGGSRDLKQETGLHCPQGPTHSLRVLETPLAITRKLLFLSNPFLLHPGALLLIRLKGTPKPSSHFLYSGNYGRIWVPLYLFQYSPFHRCSACQNTGNNIASF